MVVNTSTRDRQVVTEIFRDNETGELETIEYDDVLLKPGRSRQVSAGCFGGCGIVYCKFSVQGSKRLFRASACMVEADTAEITCVMAE